MKSKITALALLTILSFTGCRHHSATAPAKSSTAIDRKTFSMSLPGGWTEDTKDDMYDPDSFVFFENSESCLFCVFIGKKSAGLTIDAVLEEQKKSYQKKLTEFTTSTFNSWSKYQGEGIEITGKMYGAIRYRSRLFGFENGDNVCVVTEAATPADFRTYANDFETIRQSFVLK